MATEAEKLRGTLLNLVGSVERSVGDIRKNLRDTLLLSENEELD